MAREHPFAECGEATVHFSAKENVRGVTPLTRSDARQKPTG